MGGQEGVPSYQDTATRILEIRRHWRPAAVYPPLRMLLLLLQNLGEQAHHIRLLLSTRCHPIMVPLAPRWATHMGAICAAHRCLL
jgi:hypothetical protein